MHSNLHYFFQKNRQEILSWNILNISALVFFIFIFLIFEKDQYQIDYSVECINTWETKNDRNKNELRKPFKIVSIG